MNQWTIEVGDDDFESRHRLINGTFDRFPKILLLVIRCDNEADLRWKHYLESNPFPNTWIQLGRLLLETESFFRNPLLAIEAIAEQLNRAGKAIRHKLPRLIIIKDSVILTDNLVFSSQRESRDLKSSAYLAPIFIQGFVMSDKINYDLVAV